MKDYVEYGFDKLPNKMEFFRELLYTKAELPLVIYGHCEVCITLHVLYDDDVIIHHRLVLIALGR